MTAAAQNLAAVSSRFKPLLRQNRLLSVSCSKINQSVRVNLQSSRSAKKRSAKKFEVDTISVLHY
jgi:hypothetical protein